jgi:hypothetical protein
MGGHVFKGHEVFVKFYYWILSLSITARYCCSPLSTRPAQLRGKTTDLTRRDCQFLISYIVVHLHLVTVIHEQNPWKYSAHYSVFGADPAESRDADICSYIMVLEMNVMMIM